MIKNERQYRTTKTQAEKLAAALAESRKRPTSSKQHPLIRKAEEEALRSQIADLKSELRQYESLRSGSRKALARTSLEKLPQTLIQARIATGMSQADLAERLGMKPQQIQRYEATNYSSASLARVQTIARALGLRLHAEAVVT